MGRPSNIVVVTEDYRKLAERFYQYQKQLGYIATSYRARFLYLNEFLQWLEQQGILEITRVNAPAINRYYQYIGCRPSKKDGGALSQKTTHSHMRIIRDLFEMLLQEGSISVNPCGTLYFPYPRHDTFNRAILEQAEVMALYKAAQTARERAILSLSYGCGLRVGELVKCNVEDVRLREKILIVPHGKGNKRRVIPMSNGVVTDLGNYYYNERDELTKGRDYHPSEKAFMLHNRGGRMQKDTYNKYLKALIEATANPEIMKKPITVHSLRHSIATHLLERGVSVEQVRMFLGHSQLESTQIYTHISQKQLNDLIR
jgi:integrase/recombinase XerD